jgi:hypothetical protein
MQHKSAKSAKAAHRQRNAAQGKKAAQFQAIQVNESISSQQDAVFKAAHAG